MKSLMMLLGVFFMFELHINAEIKNGYAPKIEDARSALINLYNIIEEDNKADPKSGEKLDSGQKTQLNKSIKSLEKYVYYFEKTEILLEQFSSIASELYSEIDSIVDKYGNNTDVYVKFMPYEAMRISLKGTTGMDQDMYDPHICFSEYGVRTVSVTVCLGNQPFYYLAHELGHVKYQVPNLASYTAYYKKVYQVRRAELNFIGHRPDDPSGKMAKTYMKRYLECYRTYRKNNPEALNSIIALSDGFH